MFIYTIVDIRNRKGYTGKSETNPSDILNSRFYMKTNNLPVYEIIRNQGIDWFKLTVMEGDDKLYREMLKKYHDYNTEYIPINPAISLIISKKLKEYYKTHIHPTKGTKHPNVTWMGKKRPDFGYGWMITYLDKFNIEVTETIDNLQDWAKANGYEISKIKWRVQGYRNEIRKPAFPYGRIIDIKRISGPEKVVKRPPNERKRTKWDRFNQGEQEMVE